MKILVIGASGTLGQAVVRELSSRHDIITASRSSGDVNVDIKDIDSIRAMYAKVGKVDAIACTAGKVHFGPLSDMTADLMQVGIKDKLMGQVNLVLEGTASLNDGGSFSLISGILAYDPIRLGSSASLVNGALESFVKAAAIELPRGIRINAISPNVFVESMEGYGPFFRGFKPVPVADAALAYSKSIEGGQTGQVYKI
ncbi:short chain dehydrogenase [Rhizobium alvei]|uniref:Short chain dehydrogenase n=1 Tax=Rhizobium alvei TaxID=1132659 RepID=A0ABT8YGH1_9HYPH|nr:short chain dehydrogenase [Rhizobium alvei]MDO6962676.1 short chain dehydrogenase [Rhizobium alvei]